MTVRCVGCGRSIPVPADKAAEPRLRAKCRCGATFLVAEAPRVDEPAAPKPPIVATPAAFAAAIPPPAPPRATAAGVSAASSGSVAARPAAPPAAPPAPASAARPAATTRGPSASGAAPAGAGTPAARPVSWRRCVNHPARSVSVCPACGKGYCDACAAAQTVQTAVICPACDGLCVRSAQYEESQNRGQQQARSLLGELGTIFAYPLRDPTGLVMLAIFTCVFGVMARIALFGGYVGIIFSQGLLLSYCFFAVSRVASGNLRDFTPDFRGISDLTDPLRLGLGVLIVTWGPMLALMFLVPSITLLGREMSSGPPMTMAAVHAQEPPPPSAEPEAAPEEPEESPEAKEESGPTAAAHHDAEEAEAPPSRAAAAGAVVLFVVLVIWKLVYTPVALMVAALSRSFFKILNPILGIDTIRRMGGIYWQALLIYTFFAGAQWGLGFVLDRIPIAGLIVKSFLDAYAYLAVGCTLGLAVFKKSKELEWD